MNKFIDFDANRNLKVINILITQTLIFALKSPFLINIHHFKCKTIHQF